MKQKFYRELGLTLRNYRRSKNLSQDYTAAKLSISQNAYSKIQAGKGKCCVYRLNLSSDKEFIAGLNGCQIKHLSKCLKQNRGRKMQLFGLSVDAYFKGAGSGPQYMLILNGKQALNSDDD